MSVRAIGIMIGLVLMPLQALAGALSCDGFRQRLTDVLPQVDDGLAPITDYTLAYEDVVRGKRYNWVGAGLDGTLTCSSENAFQEYTVEAQFDRRTTFAERIKQITRVTGAATCALTSDPIPACRDFSRRMLEDAISQMGRAYSAGSKTPSGLSDAMLFRGVSAQLTASPTLISFLVGPGRGSSMDETRKPLDPPPPKHP